MQNIPAFHFSWFQVHNINRPTLCVFWRCGSSIASFLAVFVLHAITIFHLFMHFFTFASLLLYDIHKTWIFNQKVCFCFSSKEFCSTLRIFIWFGLFSSCFLIGIKIVFPRQNYTTDNNWLTLLLHCHHHVSKKRKFRKFKF